jgi:hypothetical protein
MQCAAVKTILGAISAPEHPWRLLSLQWISATTFGSPLAFSPPMIANAEGVIKFKKIKIVQNFFTIAFTLPDTTYLFITMHMIYKHF